MIHLRSLFTRLTRKLKALEDTIADQRELIAHLKLQDDQNLHRLQVTHENTLQDVVDRRKVMDTIQIRRDLEKQYGRTRWSKKLIDDLLIARIESQVLRLAVFA